MEDGLEKLRLMKACELGAMAANGTKSFTSRITAIPTAISVLIDLSRNAREKYLSKRELRLETIKKEYLSACDSYQQFQEFLPQLDPKDDDFYTPLKTSELLPELGKAIKDVEKYILANEILDEEASEVKRIIELYYQFDSANNHGGINFSQRRENLEKRLGLPSSSKLPTY